MVRKAAAMTSPTTARIGSAAFTLVEMLLVVTIVGVLVAVAMPRYSRSFEFMKLKSGAYDLAATIEYAQATSILEERELRLGVEPGGRKCLLAEENPPPEKKPFAPVLCELPDGISIGALDFDDPLAGAPGYIDFHPDGELEPCVIRVRARSGEAYEVFVTGGAGGVRVVRAEADRQGAP